MCIRDSTKPEHLCFFDDLNPVALELRNNTRISNAFTTGITSLTYRGSFSPVNMSGHCSLAVFKSEKVADSINGLVDSWLGSVRSATPLPAALQDAMSLRDSCVRYNFEEHHPLNLHYDKLCGSATADKLKQAMQAFEQAPTTPKFSSHTARSRPSDLGNQGVASMPDPEGKKVCEACVVQ
eukprot:TRINITY_DN5868_c0_g1_i2.p1 TRINITY_DN5868_c0_g1~~TRINITY_DN5868_c0_g1_i2.p1  ORF type:complete len:181 (+),score=36.33 TRINITY_DN5868_c0_g1_i2:93-635(+)